MAISESDKIAYRVHRRDGHSPREAWSIVKSRDLAYKHSLFAVWEYDPEPCIGCDCGSDDCACAADKPHEIEGCTVYADRFPGEPEELTSLWGICEADQPYRNYVEAELYREAASIIERRTARATEQSRVSDALIPVFSV